MKQNKLFFLPTNNNKHINGLYYDVKRDIIVSYVLGKKFGEWTETHFKEEGFTKESIARVKERILPI